MKASKPRARDWRSTAGKIVMALAFASLLGGVTAAPALAENDWDHDRRFKRNEERREQERRAEQWRERHAYRPYVYTSPSVIYSPPPVYYEAPPPPPPGLNLVFPIEIR